MNITEYTSLATAGNGEIVMAGAEPSRTTQEVAVGPLPVTSQAFDSATRFVRVHAPQSVRIAFGEDPVVTPSSTLLPAGATEFFGVVPGHRVAVQSAE